MFHLGMNAEKHPRLPWQTAGTEALEKNRQAQFAINFVCVSSSIFLIEIGKKTIALVTWADIIMQLHLYFTVSTLKS